SGGWSHLHFDISSRQPSGRWGTEEGYAFIWEAYLRVRDPAIIAVARPHAIAWTGERVRLDASRSFAKAGIARCDWTFCDGTRAAGAIVERAYERAGTYSEILKVVDREGRSAYDFAVVQIFDRETPQPPIGIQAAFAPTLGVRPGDPVTFAVRTFGTTDGEEVWDFGDGSTPVRVKSDGNVKPLAKDGFALATHAYAKPGDYIARVERSAEDGRKAVGHVWVRVEGGAGRPNVLLIMTDDQGWGDIRSHGNERIDTPVLDRLAASGARFDRFFVSSVCAPTRASLLTGRYHLRTGTTWVTHGREVMRAEETTIAEALRAAGYATGCFGKWHNGAYYPHHPNGQGFDEFLGFCGGHWNEYFDPMLERNGEPVATKGYITDVLTDAAIAFIRRNRGQPFFCYIPYNAPHSPFQVPDRYFETYEDRGFGDADACVYGMVENIDDNVGRILEVLDETGLADRTIVIFLTDNGPNTARFNGGMRGRKGSVDEGGVRVPLFIRWPGRIAPGTVVRRISAHIDLFPTILELAGVPARRTPPLDGRSLAPLLLGRGGGWPARMLFRHQSRRGDAERSPGAVRTDRHLLVVEAKRYRLYDMIDDPGETKDLTRANPDLVKDLAAAYDVWFGDVMRAGVGPFPIPVGHPEAPRVDLLAPDARFEGGLRFRNGMGWANDWIANWRTLDDAASWEIDVVRAGRYAVSLLYTCPENDVGSRIRVEVGDASVEAAISKAHDPAPRPSRDRVPRGEAVEKVWAELEMGGIDLPVGRARPRVRATRIPGTEAMELKALRLRLSPERTRP
ncbi:MAG: sulfatase-like hydrolase/transferase, partial [Planctomycetes bacterium]|nr:sulfatase-like hydrolase/transferase [Planctomycetota bacterium]